MSIWGNLDGTLRSRFNIGKKSGEVYLERDGSDNLTLRDLVVTTAQKLVDLISRTRTSQLAGLTEATSSARLDLLLLELASGGALRKITKANLIPLPTDYLSGFGTRCNLTNPAYQLDIALGVCRSDDDSTDFFSLGTLTADITVSGANGLDTGVEAANTWYYVWVIYNPTTDTYASLLSISPTAPTLPSGFTKKRRVGVVRNDSSSNFLAFRQVPTGSRIRIYLYSETEEQTLEVLTSGTATAWTDVDLSAFVPATSELAILSLMYYGANAGADALHVRPNGSTVDTPVVRQFAGTTATGYASASAMWFIKTGTGQIVEYKNGSSASAAYIWVYGFIDEV